MCLLFWGAYIGKRNLRVILSKQEHNGLHDSNSTRCIVNHSKQQLEKWMRQTSDLARGYGKTHLRLQIGPLCLQASRRVWGRAARWHTFKPKIPTWVNFEGSFKGRCLVHFIAVWNIPTTAIWCILW
jgi:hypothetical protein